MVKVGNRTLVYSTQFICPFGEVANVVFKVDGIELKVSFIFIEDESFKEAKIGQNGIKDDFIQVELKNWQKSPLGVSTPYGWKLAKVNDKQVTMAAWGNSMQEKIKFFVQFMIEGEELDGS